MDESIGHYRIVEELGRGGMGVVYKAREESLNRYVALKVLGEHLSQDPSFVARFEREAQSAASLQHPNIVHIFFIGEDAGRHYFAMELVDGRSLRDVIAERGRLPADEAVGLMLQAASGLGAAHDRDLLHRDIKPANMMLTQDGRIKIADFGLALPMDMATRLTATGALLGTPAYVSPEQCEGLKPDRRSDIYSLGLTFYEMLSGRVPFQADSPMGLLRQILQTEPPPLRELVPDVDPRLERILGRMMAKDREQRYGSCHEIIADLEAFRRGDEVSARPVVPPPLPVAPAAGDGSLTQQATIRLPEETAAVPSPPGAVPVAPSAPRRGGRTALVAVAAVVLLLASVAAATVLVLGKQWSSRDTVVPVPLADLSRDAEGPQSSSTSDPMPTDTTAPSGIGVGPSGLEAAEVGTGAPDRSLPEVEPSAGGAPIEAVDLSPAPGGRTAATAFPRNSLATSPTAAGAAAPSPRTSTREVPARPVVAEPPSRPPLPSRPRVAVVGTGEPLLAIAAEEWLEEELARRGVDIVAEDSVPAVNDLLRAPLGVQELLAALDRGEIHVLVLAEADFVGERTLYYLNRSDRALTSRLRLNAFLTGNARAVWPGSSEELEYTEVNARRQAEKGLLPVVNDLVEEIDRGWTAFRRQH